MRQETCGRYKVGERKYQVVPICDDSCPLLMPDDSRTGAHKAA